MRKGWSQRNYTQFWFIDLSNSIILIQVVIAAKTVTPHPKLPGTIYTAAQKSKLFNKLIYEQGHA